MDNPNDFQEISTEFQDYTNTTYIGTWPDYILTEEACLKAGGHCWNPDTSYSFEETVYRRHCRHCGKKQTGTSQESIRWEDD